MDGLWAAQASLTVDGKVHGPLELDASAPITIGRSRNAGLSATDRRMPRELASIHPRNEGWVVHNERSQSTGDQPSMRARSAFIEARDGARFAARARLLLQPAVWRLSWEVGVAVELTIRPLPRGLVDLPLARDRHVRDDSFGTLRPDPIVLSGLERRRMAALFEYLLLNQGGPPEPRFIRAARLADCSPGQLRSTRQTVAHKIARHRGDGFLRMELEELGELLVAERAIDERDLPS